MSSNLGMLRVHLLWILNKPATWEHYNHPAAGVNFRWRFLYKSRLPQR